MVELGSEIQAAGLFCHAIPLLEAASGSLRDGSNYYLSETPVIKKRADNKGRPMLGASLTFRSVKAGGFFVACTKISDEELTLGDLRRGFAGILNFTIVK
jgi:hypothetical protein